MRRIYFYETVTSTLDKSFELIARGNLEIWDSVLSVEQTNGRGQMRRFWASPPGNIYASIRLPKLPPFNSFAGSVAVGALCARALREIGWNVSIKWPNDLVICNNGHAQKTGGILLEEHSYSLVAGIGINVGTAPQLPRENGILPITCIMDAAINYTDAGINGLWAAIVKNIVNDYYSSPSFADNWMDMARETLIWLDNGVVHMDGSIKHHGIMKGIGPQGGVLLLTSSGLEEFVGGTLKSGEWESG